MKKMYSVLVRLSKALTIIFAAILIIASLTINNMSFDNPSFDIFASLMWASLVISPICGVAWFVFVIKERQEEEKQEQERRRIQRQSKPRGRQSSEDGKCVKNLSGYSKIEAIWPYNDSCIPFVCKEDDKYVACSVSVKLDANHELTIFVQGSREWRREYRKAQVKEQAILYVSDNCILKLDAHNFKLNSRHYAYIGDIPELSDILKLNLNANFISASLQDEGPDIISCAPKHKVHLDINSMVSDLNEIIARNIRHLDEYCKLDDYYQWKEKLPIRISEIEKLPEGWLVSWGVNGWNRVLTLQYAEGVPTKLSCWTFNGEDKTEEHRYIELI